MSHDPKKLQLESERHERRRPILDRLAADLDAAHKELHERHEAATQDFHDTKARLRAAADREIKKIDRDFPDLEPWNPDRS